MKDQSKTKQELLKDNFLLKQKIQELEQLESERKRESEGRFKLMFMNAPLPYQSLDENGHFIDVNQALLDVLCYTREELIGRSFGDFLHPDWVDHFKENFPRFKAIGEVLGVEFEMVKKDGSTILVSFNGRIQRDDQGCFQSTHCIFQNITERKQAEEALQRKAHDLRESQRIAHVGSWRLDVSTNQVVWTEELYNIYGFDPSLPPPPYTEHMKLFTPESWERLSTALAHTRETGIPYMLELETIRKDGSNGWMWVQGEADVDSAGKTVEIWGAAQDITDRKQAEEALRESEEKYRNLFVNANEAIFVVQDGKLVFLNPMTTMITGYSGEELTSKPFAEFIHPDDRDMVFDRHVRRMRGEKFSYIYSFRIIHRDGNIVWVELNAVLINWKGKAATLNFLSNITERKRVEDALRESEELLNLAMAVKNEGIWDWNLVTNKAVFDDRYYTMAGYEPGEFPQDFTGWADHVHPDDLPHCDAAIKAYLSMQSERFDIEFRFKHKDGSWIWIQGRGRIVERDENGAPQRIIGTHSDITERKWVESEMKRMNIFLDSIIENIPNMLFLKDAKDLRFVRFNRAGEELLGQSRDDLIGKNDYDFFPKTQADYFTEKDREVLSGKKMIDIPEEQIQTHTGEKTLHTKKMALLDEAGEPAFLLGISEDITDRKRAEEALRESRDEIQWLFKSMINAFVLFESVFDNKGNFISYRFIYINDAYEHITGVKNDEVKGKTVHEVWPETEPEWIKKYGEVAVTGVASTFDMYHDPTNKFYHCNVYRPWNTKDRFCVIFEDITERKQAEEEKRSLTERLQIAEKMESLGLLAGGVAHDLNNVLGIVVGYAELLLFKANESSEIRPQLEQIMKGGQKAAAIVEDLLTLARRGVPSRNIINLNKIITDNQKSPEFANLFSHYSNVKIKTDLDPEILNISGSFVHLSKTLLNLVSNASEAMKKGGYLTIKTLNQYLDKPIQGYDKIQEGDYVVLSVSDTGEGINANDMKRIFEPFYTKKVMGRSGTGLGLAVVWGTVKDHNGYINVQSEEGKGSTFTLYFPVTREELSGEHVAVSISEYMGKGETILVVDDVKGQRDLAEEMLKKLNYSVTSSSSGEEALAYLKDHRVDLMVLDMIMDPGMDGLDTYKSVLEIRPEQKAIIVSGFSESDRVKAARDLGAGTYVKKPYVIEKLGLAVRKELDRST